MGRGLGPLQRDFLVEMLTLERSGRASRRGTMSVVTVLNGLWHRRWRTEWEAVQRRAQADDEAWRADVRMRAERSESDAVEALHRLRRMDVIAHCLRGWRRSQRGLKVRDFPSDIEASVNPSRVFALLERRGLVLRLKNRGHFSSVRLTSDGRTAAIDSMALSDLCTQRLSPGSSGASA